MTDTDPRITGATFEEMCRKANALHKNDPPPDLPTGWETMEVGQLWDALNDLERIRRQAGGHALQVTYDAVQYALRHHGMRALKDNERRLTELSERQLKDLITSLNKVGAEEALLEALARILPHADRRGRAD